MQIVRPRPVQAASIPGMLGMFQNVCHLIILLLFKCYLSFDKKKCCLSFSFQCLLQNLYVNLCRDAILQLFHSFLSSFYHMVC